MVAVAVVVVVVVEVVCGLGADACGESAGSSVSTTVGSSRSVSIEQ